MRKNGKGMQAVTVSYFKTTNIRLQPCVKAQLQKAGHQQKRPATYNSCQALNISLFYFIASTCGTTGAQAIISL